MRVKVKHCATTDKLKWYDTRVFMPDPSRYWEGMGLVMDPRHPTIQRVVVVAASPINRYTDMDIKPLNHNFDGVVLAFMPNPEITSVFTDVPDASMFNEGPIL